ncbi:MAG TPA: hypothetical protein VHP12_09820 [Chitinophagaceae bacterium]|nr:hypothetical protein [Chitinophagaceae bacterium]
MNAIILSALLGVVMMFSSIFTQNKIAIRNIAIIGLLVLLAGNLLNIYTAYSFDIDSHNMLRFEKFGLFFNTIAIVSTLLYVILSGSDIVKVGNYPAEYFALLFFVMKSYRSIKNNTILLRWKD